MWENTFNLLINDELQANVHRLPGSGVVSIDQKPNRNKQATNRLPQKTETKDWWSVYVVTWKINIFIFCLLYFIFFK